MDNKKILSIEDDKFLSSLVARKLSAAGYEMSHAASGEEAIKMVKEVKPSLVLLDILLPEMSGFEVLEKIKADPITKDIPVILFSNLGQKEDIDKGLTLGAEKFIIKATVVLDDIVREIEQVLGSQVQAPSPDAAPTMEPQPQVQEGSSSEETPKAIPQENPTQTKSTGDVPPQPTV